MTVTERDTKTWEAGGPPPEPARLLGTYPQKQEGLFMQRIPVFAGRISWTRWRRIAQIARRYTPGVPLHFTTRQDIELHNVRRADVPQVLEELALAGISTFAACGDCIRNITVNPAWEADPYGIDVTPLALLVREHLLANAPIHSLPRKFKISFSGSWTHHSQPYLNDLGFTALRPDLFEAAGAGSLGGRPEPGILLYAGLAAEEVVPLCHAAVEMFNDLGDRENRRQARLRHVRMRLGDEEFKRQLHRRFEAAKAKYPQAKLTLAKGRADVRRLHVLSLPAGNLDPEAALALADAAEPKGAAVRINLTHGLELYGPQPVDLPEAVAPFAGRLSIVACPGADTCPKALVHTKAAAERLYAWSGASLKGRTIAVSGCPNDCGRSRTAEIGLAGRLRTVDGRRQECFEIFTGGGSGAGRQLGISAGEITAEELIANPDVLSEIVTEGTRS